MLNSVKLSDHRGGEFVSIDLDLMIAGHLDSIHGSNIIKIANELSHAISIANGTEYSKLEMADIVKEQENDE